MDTLVKAAEQHFLDEEDRALPRLAVVFTADDMAALERRRRTLPKEMRATFLAAEEGAARRMGAHDLIASLPLSVRINLALRWRRRYRKLVGPILAIR